jgi:hypothetical protein
MFPTPFFSTEKVTGEYRLGHLGVAVSGRSQRQFNRVWAFGIAGREVDDRYLQRSGLLENYVRPITSDALPATGAKRLVWKDGRVSPVWRPDGKELFYVTVTGSLMAVDIDTSKGFRAGRPRRLFNAPLSASLETGWDVSPDGKRFLFAAPPRDPLCGGRQVGRRVEEAGSIQ